VRIRLEGSRAGSNTTFAARMTTIVVAESRPNSWIGTKLERQRTKKPKKRIKET
jgi:hypothetical protein